MNEKYGMIINFIIKIIKIEFVKINYVDFNTVSDSI